MKPDAATHRTYMRQLDADDNEYVRHLISKLVDKGLEINDIAKKIGLTPRMLRMYRQEVRPCKPPYPVIYTLQRLIEAA